MFPEITLLKMIYCNHLKTAIYLTFFLATDLLDINAFESLQNLIVLLYKYFSVHFLLNELRSLSFFVYILLLFLITLLSLCLFFMVSFLMSYGFFLYLSYFDLLPRLLDSLVDNLS